MYSFSNGQLPQSLHRMLMFINTIHVIIKIHMQWRIQVCYLLWFWTALCTYGLLCHYLGCVN